MPFKTFAAFLFAASLSGQTPDLTIHYTGKLLGYPRIPDVQRAHLKGWLIQRIFHSAGDPGWQKCQEIASDCQRLYEFDKGGDPSPAAKRLTELFANEPKTDLLLGMGDNFAVDYLARTIVARQYEGQDEYVAKDELFYYKDDGTEGWLDLRDPEGGATKKSLTSMELTGRSKIPVDNVAAFFTGAGYTAMVPGKQDFYFGPERLRQLSGLLAQERNGGPGTQMLAANLVLISNRTDSPALLDDATRAKRQNFVTSHDDTSWSLPKTALPWIRSFRLKNYRDATGKLFVDPTAGADLVWTEERDKLPINPPALAVRHLVFNEAPPPNDKDAIYRLADDMPVKAERTYLLCVTLTAPKDKRKPKLCTAVDVQSPFFQYPDNKYVEASYSGNISRKVYATESLGVAPWAKVPGAVVMGVVAAGLETTVGALNSQYIHANDDGTIGKSDKVDTAVVAVDPAEALSQMLEFCDQTGDCPKKRLILMAQMPRDEAAVLNDRLERRFDAVIAQADSSFPTAMEKVEYAAGHRPVVLVPRELRDREAPKFGVQVQIARLHDMRRAQSLVTGATERLELELPPLQGNPCLRTKIDLEWRKMGPKAPRELLAVDRFHGVVLNAMRSAAGADVAILQDRDFYQLDFRIDGCATYPLADPLSALRSSLEQILWKGDFLVSKTITGAALKAALKESDRVKNLEEKSYRLESESGKWLQTFGLYQDPATQTWYANGAAIQDTTLYSVAMSDFLASGDTGYTDLKDPAVPPGPRVRQMKNLERIADAVLATIDSRFVRDKLLMSQYLDHANFKPFPAAPQATAGQQLANTIRNAISQPHPDLGKGRDWIGQTRPYWRIFLDKGEFGFTDYHHNAGTQDKLKGMFANTTESGVLAAQSRTVPVGLQAEVRREWRGHHLFSRTELDYSLSRTQQAGPAGRYLQTYPANKVSLETGYRAAFTQTMRSRPWNGWFVSSYNETNPREPHAGDYPASVAPGCIKGDAGDCPVSLTFESDLARTSRVLGKLGLRRENEQNWLELGAFAGSVFRPTALATLQSGQPVATPDTFCRLSDLVTPTGITTLNDCLTSTFKVVVPNADAVDAVSQTLSVLSKSSSKIESGLFANFNYRVPMPKNAVVKDLYFEQRGNFYFNHGRDTVVDTRFNEKVSFGPTISFIPSVPGLTFKPTYTLFWYESKITRNRLTARTIDFKLDYRFDWKTGAAWGQVLRYGRPK